ncbi:pyruvate kinase alpha/beta domain-containing protein, partial [Staphylococcus capitis]|uniref:pyruvate kinase alpha/beta domain-containing protein n=1 Tax=Staphylococcus capitis TaxID=29388 RepID=UPI0028CB3D2B
SDIIGVTGSEETAGECGIVWGVNGVVKEGGKKSDGLVNKAVGSGVESGRVCNGELMIISGGVGSGEKGRRKMMKIQLVGDEIGGGEGVGGG